VAFIQAGLFGDAQLAPFGIRSPSYFKMSSKNVLTESQSTRSDCHFLCA
jgi:hypothetical protein